MPMVLLLLGLGAALLSINALAPRRDAVFLIPSFFASWLAIELAPWALASQVVITGVVVAAGGLEGPYQWAGVLGLASMAISWAGLVVIVVRAARTPETMDGAITEAAPPRGPDDAAPCSFPRHQVVFPALMRRRRGVERVRNVVYGEDDKRQRLDVYRSTGDGANRPGILQIHGGAWVLGDKREQGIPLLNHLAACGWVGINANYRLSPRVAFPAHLIDLKRAITWYRANAAEFGADPDFLCVTGGSAGGHLAALVALTANDPSYQPGFEDVDTSVRAAIPFYGVYDFTNRLGSLHRDTVRRFIEPIVMKRRLADDPEAFARASPMDQVRPDAPPFLVIHGSHDTLAPVADARHFVERLREVSQAPVLYAELRGAQHAFDIFPSYRTARVVEAVERFVTSVRSTAVPASRKEPEEAGR